MGIGLPQQILCFMDLIGSIDRNQNRTDLCGCPESNEPGRYVGGPDSNLHTGTDTQGNQRTGKIIHIFPELFIRTGIVQGGVFEGILVREFLHHPVQDLGESQIDQVILLPDILSGAIMVIVQRLLAGTGVIEPAHVVDKMGKNDLPVLQVFHPLPLPLQRNEAVVVDGAEGADHIGNGHIAFADEVIGILIVRVPQMDVLHVSTQVLDGGIGALIKVPVRMVHIPKGTGKVTGVAFQKSTQLGSIGIDTAGLDENADTLLFCQGQQPLQIAVDHLFVGAGCPGHHIRHFQIMCNVHHVRKDVRIGFTFRKIQRSIQTGNRKLQVPQLPDGGCDIVLVERSAAIGHFRELEQIVDFNAGELHVQGGMDHLIPMQVAPAAGGKGEIHTVSSS